MSEDALHITVIQWLRYQCPHILFWHCPNGAKRHIGAAMRMKAMGMLAGVGDIELHWRTPEGTHKGMIELKWGDNAQTMPQKNFEQSWRFFGGQYAVCKSLEQVIDTLKQWGAIGNVVCPPKPAEDSIFIDHVKPRQKGRRGDK
jgi:hypothetical protein